MCIWRCDCIDGAPRTEKQSQPLVEYTDYSAYSYGLGSGHMQAVLCVIRRLVCMRAFGDPGASADRWVGGIKKRKKKRVHMGVVECGSLRDLAPYLPRLAITNMP